MNTMPDTVFYIGMNIPNYTSLDNSLAGIFFIVLWLVSLMPYCINHNRKTFVKKERDENDIKQFIDELRQIHPLVHDSFQSLCAVQTISVLVCSG